MFRQRTFKSNIIGYQSLPKALFTSVSRLFLNNSIAVSRHLFICECFKLAFLCMRGLPTVIPKPSLKTSIEFQSVLKPDICFTADQNQHLTFGQLISFSRIVSALYEGVVFAFEVNRRFVQATSSVNQPSVKIEENIFGPLSAWMPLRGEILKKILQFFSFSYSCLGPRRSEQSSSSLCKRNMHFTFMINTLM